MDELLGHEIFIAEGARLEHVARSLCGRGFHRLMVSNEYDGFDPLRLETDEELRERVLKLVKYKPEYAPREDVTLVPDLPWDLL